MEHSPAVDTTLDERVLRLAVPKGRLADLVMNYMADRGLGIPPSLSDRRLTLMNEEQTIEFILAKPADVPTFVAHGIADAGVAGLDNLREENPDVLEPFHLPLSTWRMSVAGFPEWRDRPLQGMHHLRVATKYTRIASEYFASRGINAEIIKLNGSVELAPLTGLADVILDIVETGETLNANGLVELHHVMECRPLVIVNRAAFHLRSGTVGGFLKTMHPQEEQG